MPDPAKLLHRVDDFQQRHWPLAFVYAVIRKYGQDSASTWALLIAYYGFASLFPLLLVAVTLTGIIFAHNPSLSHRISTTVFSQIPVIGPQLRSKSGVHVLDSHSALGLIIGVLGLLWGAQGVASAAQEAMATVWNVPMTDRPGALFCADRQPGRPSRGASRIADYAPAGRRRAPLGTERSVRSDRAASISAPPCAPAQP